MQKPTIGRVVILHPNNDNFFTGKAYDNEPIPAMVTKVHPDGEVALTAFPAGMAPVPCYKVPYVAPGGLALIGQCYWEWPVIEKKEDSPKKEYGNFLDKDILEKTGMLIDRAPSGDEQEPAKKELTDFNDLQDKHYPPGSKEREEYEKGFAEELEKEKAKAVAKEDKPAKPARGGKKAAGGTPS